MQHLFYAPRRSGVNLFFAVPLQDKNVQKLVPEARFLKSELASSVLFLRDAFMKTLNLLLAGSDRRAANLVQAVVLDACYNQAAVQTIRTSRLDELLGLGCRDGIDLIIVTPNNLETGCKSAGASATIQEVAQALEMLKRHNTRPVIALNVRASDEMLFRDAGVDAVFCFPFDGGAVKARVRRLLQLTDGPQPVTTGRPSLATLIFRAFQRPKTAA